MKKEIVVILAAMTLAGCALQEKRVEQSLTQPINCDIAEGDIRVLEIGKSPCGKASCRRCDVYCSGWDCSGARYRHYRDKV